MGIRLRLFLLPVLILGSAVHGSAQRRDPAALIAVERGQGLIDTSVISDSFADFHGRILTRPVNYRRHYNIRNQRFDNAWLKNTVNFDSAALSVSVDFSGARFDSSAMFRQAYFAWNPHFANAEFGEQALFSRSVFGANFDPDLLDLIPEDSAAMKEMGLRAANFYNTRFMSVAYFDTTLYWDQAYFSSARFYQGVTFSGSVFYKDVYFSNASFAKYGGHFRSTRFDGKAFFDHLDLADSNTLYFDNAVLPGFLDFSFNQKIPLEIDLTAADFADSVRYDPAGKRYNPHLIFLYKTDISKFHLDYTHFRLYFPDSVGRTKVPDDEKEGMYEALLNNFKTRGQQESYKLLDIEYRQFKWQRKGTWVSDTGIWVDRYWWNFGYNKEYIFIWTVLLVAFFTLINFFGLEEFSKVYAVENIPTLPPLAKLVKGFEFDWDAIQMRFWYAFVYTCSIFFRLTLKWEKMKFESVNGTIFITVQYVLGLLCLAYMVNFVVQK